MGIRFDNEVMRFFYPAAWDGEWQGRLLELSRDVGLHSVREMRRALAFVRAADPYDQEAIKGFTLELAREIARADLALIGRIKALRREMVARIQATGGPTSHPAAGHAALPWAAESARLGRDRCE